MAAHLPARFASPSSDPSAAMQSQPAVLEQPAPAPLQIIEPTRKASTAAAANTLDKPQNGLAGLKHWPYDLRSGLMVAMISLPFSMGIAITSGAPPVCGIMSAIIAGFLLPSLGGSYVTIS